MVFRQNYDQQRTERNRLRQAKKEAKEQERRDAVLRRKAGRNAAITLDPESAKPDLTQSPDGVEEPVRS